VDRALHLSDELFLEAFHFGGAARGRIVETVEMKEAVGDVDAQLLVQGRAETASLTFRGLGADEYFSVLERDDVGGTGLIQKPSMDGRHAAI